MEGFLDRVGSNVNSSRLNFSNTPVQIHGSQGEADAKGHTCSTRASRPTLR